MARQGSVGPSGAGKTTTVECIVGLRMLDDGAISVLGLHPQSDRGRLRECVGVQPQESKLPAKLKVWEVLDLYRSFYRDPADPGQLMDALGLAAKRNDYFKKLSGRGERANADLGRRLF